MSARWGELLALLVSTGSLACNSSPSPAAPTVAATADIGPEGGSLVAADGTRIDVPGGALGAMVTLTLELAPGATAPSDGNFVGTPYALEPDWLQFAAPISVTLTVDPSQVPGGSSPGAVLVLIAEADAGGYLAVPGTATDATHVVAHTTHFSTGGAAVASCPVQCGTTTEPAGPLLQCSTTCVGHMYTLACAGPPGSELCSCIVDGVVAAVGDLDAGGLDAAEAIYATSCNFPATSWTGSLAGPADAGSD
jgi:hypothetical protein